MTDPRPSTSGEPVAEQLMTYVHTAPQLARGIVWSDLVAEMAREHDRRLSAAAEPAPPDRPAEAA